MQCSRAKACSEQVFHRVCAEEVQISESNKAILEAANAAIADIALQVRFSCRLTKYLRR
jgi:hypothetical protein